MFSCCFGINKTAQVENWLLVGVTGRTGPQVVAGILDIVKEKNMDNVTLYALSRSVDKESCRILEEQGINTVAGDLSDESSLSGAMAGMTALYIHGTNMDSEAYDPDEVMKAQNLLEAASKSETVKYIVFNSEGGVDTKITHVEQSREIEQLIKDTGIDHTILRATLFMDEFWRDAWEARDGVLNGRFVFVNCMLKMCSVRDIGRVAATILIARTTKQKKKYIGKVFELASEELSSSEIAEQFSVAQGVDVTFEEMELQATKDISSEVFKMLRFCVETGYDANVQECKRLFPFLMNFQEYLELTDWKNPDMGFDSLQLPQWQAQEDKGVESKTKPFLV